MNQILFLDIDGVLIPRRVYDMPGQTRPLVTKFDPGVVGMLNTLARTCDYRFVIHSSWLRSAFNPDISGPNTKDHMVSEGLKAEYFHEDHSAVYRLSGNRWTAIRDWLGDHPEVSNYWIIEDEPCPYTIHGQGGDNQIDLNRVVTTDFDEGLTYAQYRMMRDSNSNIDGME